MSRRDRKPTGWTVLVAFFLVGLLAGEVAAQGPPDGQLTVAFDASIASSFLDPAETAGIATPFVFLYALHDALIKPLPGNDMAPCLAESWRESADGLVYEFKLREGVRFHNGDPFTAEDVKFSFHRYRGVSAKLLHERVKAVQVVDPHRVRFVLHTPWPDFLAFYATPATGAAWIVPRKHIEKVGEDGFSRQPVGLGPYRFVRMNPGVELVLEANEQYWRKKPAIKRIVIKGVPDRTTRLGMLKTGEADIGYLMVGVEAATIKADPRLRLAKVIPSATWWVEFLEQWKPRSPWHDRRVRLAASHAIDRKAVNQAETLGFSRLTDSIVPRVFQHALPFDPPPYDPAKAKQLLAEAGFPNGFDAGDFTPFPPYFSMGEAVAGYLQGVGIKSRIRTMERATFLSEWHDKKLRGIVLAITGAFGNAATRLEPFVTKNGIYAYGFLPQVDDLYARQARESDPKKREALLHQVQEIVHDQVLYVPIYELAFIWGVGPRVQEPCAGLIVGFPYSAPLEDVTLKK